MTFTVKDVLTRASLLLQDVNGTRWPFTEQLMWLNDGVNEIVLHKPTATAQTVELPLSVGTLQELPDGYNTLIEVTRNIASGGPGIENRFGQGAITAVSRSLADAFLPHWSSPNIIQNTAIVQHVIVNTDTPRSFYVLPGNDGTGLVEAVVSILPAAIQAPAMNQSDINSYTATVEMQDAYLGALVDFVCFRSFSKDSALPGAAQRAAQHYQLFAQAIGLKLQGELRNPNKQKEKPQG